MRNVTQSDSPYKASLTREQFCFYEMRTTAKLMSEGLSDEGIMSRIVRDNLFQYPTEKSVRKIAQMCVSRLHSMNNTGLVTAIAEQPVDVSKQVCLYAMMKDSRLVWDFMLTVVAEKYRSQNMKLTKMDLNMFFMRLQEQDNGVAAWSESTITKIKQILTRILVENGYLDNNKSETLKPVLICSTLLNAILADGEKAALPAFNYFR